MHFQIIIFSQNTTYLYPISKSFDLVFLVSLSHLNDKNRFRECLDVLGTSEVIDKADFADDKHQVKETYISRNLQLFISEVFSVLFS